MGSAGNTVGSNGSGGQGEVLSDPHHQRADAILVARAARSRWPVTKAKRRKIVDRLMGVLEGSDDDRSIIAASKALIAADAINAKREGGGAPAVNVGVNVGVSVAGLRQELAADAGYLEYLRTHQANGDAGPVRANGELRALGNGSPSNGAGPGNNGHHHGG